MASAPTKGSHFIIIGGGISGVACVETLCHLCPSSRVTLLSASSLVKAATNVHQVGRAMEEFSIEEKDASFITSRFSNLTIVNGFVAKVDAANRVVILKCGQRLEYSKLCICTGGIPKMVANSPYVVGIRDTESVSAFQEKLKGAKRVIVIGNGGIATELVYELSGCEVLWAIKHNSISATFFDEGAAQFFLPHLNSSEVVRQSAEPAAVEPAIRFMQRITYITDGTLRTETGQSGAAGSALGPDWAKGFQLIGGAENIQASSRKVKVEYGVELKRLLTSDEFLTSGETEATGSDRVWPVYAQLTNDRVFGADIIVSATGVSPNAGFILAGQEHLFQVANDGGLVVDTEMKTTCADVYACGDVCSAAAWRHSPLWWQMRLWTQARQMGAYAGKCMAAHSAGKSQPMDFCFELFTHVTEFFGFKVVLLGLFNGQGLDIDEYQILIRVTPGKEFVKAVLKDGKTLVGAVLIGDTGLEETFENVILNGTNLEHIASNLLEPGIDIDDFFD